MPVFVYTWGNNSLRRARMGQRCQVLARGAKGTVLVVFEDGFKMTTSHRALREHRDSQPRLFELDSFG